MTVGHVGPMKDEYVLDGIPFLRSQDVEPFRLNMDSVKFISEVFHKKLNKSSLHPGDVVVVRTGYPGTACVIPTSLPVANCANLVIVKPSDRLNSFFLACLFNSTWGRKSVSGSLVGVAQQHFNVTVAKEMIIPLPPRKVQDKIATILSAYDDLIENNLRRIKILEEMAQTLYREWYVKLRFPGHQKVKIVDSPLGKIPEGWETKTIGDVCTVIPGYAFKSSDWQKSGVPVVKIKNINSDNTINTDETDCVSEDLLKSTMEKFFLKDGDILIAMTGATAGKIGKLRSRQRMLLNQRVAKIEPHNPYNAFVWCTIWTEECQARFFRLADGAAQPNMSGHQIEGFPILLPMKALCQDFSEMVNPFLLEIDNLIHRNRNLRQTRDLLLPKLISGELDISELDITIPEANA